jgi:hypothetical protein
MAPSRLVGRTLGTFEILASLGAGGMGEVYRARDARLGRDVALKVLPEDVAEDPNRRARFEREARLIGAVSHPNILSLFDVGESDGIVFAIFELLEGETLRERLRSGPIPAPRAAEIAAGIARGLAAAHAKGVVHRDLKPENVFLTADGGVKVLDFGLARQVTTADRDQGATAAETEDLLTGAGTVLGTVGYLSPEQVRGETVDHRSDIFALGCVLHEMLSGRRPFVGETSPEILTAVLREEPPKLEPSPALPGLVPIVDRCLVKDPDRRFQSASDLAFAIDSLSGRSSDESTATARAQSTPPLRGRLLMAAGVIAAVALGYALAGLLAPTHGSGRAPEFERITFRRGPIFQARFAPGDTSVFYSASWDGEPAEIFETTLSLADARSLDLAPAILLSVSKEGELAVALSPRFPLTYYQPGRLARLPMTGGVPPRELLDEVSTADWDPVTGELVVARNLADRTTDLEWPLGSTVYHTDRTIGSLRVSPDGRHVAFFEYGGGANVVILDRSGNRTSLEESWGVTSGGLAWSPDGKEVWFSATADWSPAKLWALRPGASPRLVLALPGGIRLQDIAADGRVLLTLWNYRISLHGGEMSSPDTRDLSWFGWSFAGDLSGDGKNVLFSDLMSEGPGESNCWLFRPLNGEPAVLLASSGSERLSYFGAKLSPDDRFAAIPSDDGRSFRIEAVGTGEPRSISLPAGVRFSYSLAWLPDGRGLIFIGSRDGGDDREVFELLLDGSPPRALRKAIESELVLSSDGSWTAGRLDDFRLRLVRGSGEEERELQVDAPLGRLIRWSDDGSSLFFYRQGEVPGAIYRVELDTAHVSLVRQLMPPNPAGVWRIHPVVMSADGRHYAYSASRWMSDLYVFEGLS